jgi:hypothetical protein
VFIGILDAFPSVRVRARTMPGPHRLPDCVMGDVHGLVLQGCENRVGMGMDPGLGPLHPLSDPFVPEPAQHRVYPGGLAGWPGG